MRVNATILDEIVIRDGNGDVVVIMSGEEINNRLTIFDELLDSGVIDEYI